MTRAKISQYSATANDNTDVNGINIAEGCPPSSMNNMGREIMAALKRFQVGSDGDGVTVGGSFVVSGSTTANTFSATQITASGPVITSAGTASAPAIVPTGDTNTGIFFPAADTIAFAEGGAEAMRINSSGNVLIGTTTSTNNIRLGAKLAVVATGGGTNYGGALFTSYSGTSAMVAPFLDFNRSRGTTDGSMTKAESGDTLGYLVFRGSDGTNFLDSSFIKGEVDGATGTNDMPGRLTFFTSADGTGSPLERMRIDSSGNVGIGTTSPSSYSSLGYRLVVGDGSGNEGITIATGTGDNGSLLFADGTSGSAAFAGYVQYDHSDNSMKFGTNGSERARITSGGILLVGTTSTTSSNVGSKLQVNSEIFSIGSTGGFFWENRSGGVTVNSNWYGWYTTGGTIYIYNGASNIGSINSSTGVYTALSDKNKKKDFEESTLGLDAVMQLKPTLYRMKDAEDDSAKDLGFIAQDVKDVIPQAYVERTSEDAVGNESTYIGLNDRPIIAVLVNAVKELKAITDTQAQTISALEARIAALENGE